jgi:tRNA(fMet)-specific endonuclease VapC
MYLLDTNICIAILKNNLSAVRTFSPRSQHCYLSTIVVAELYKGVYWSQRIEDNRDALFPTS